MDIFTTAYITCALWASTDESTPQGGNPLDDNYTWEDIDADTLDKMKADCEKFQDDNWDMIESDLQNAGHDFWLTRNRHGCGFWDGDWPENGDTLDERAKAYGEYNLYVGDDKKIYGYPG